MPSRGGLVGWLSRATGVSRQAVSGKIQRTAYTPNRAALEWAVEQYLKWKREGLDVPGMMTRFRQFPGWQLAHMLHSFSMNRSVFADHQVGVSGSTTCATAMRPTYSVRVCTRRWSRSDWDIATQPSRSPYTVTSCPGCRKMLFEPWRADCSARLAEISRSGLGGVGS